MARNDQMLTKTVWINALEERIDQWSIITGAQQWLQHQMMYFSDDIPEDYVFSPGKMVDFIRRQAKREYLDDRGTLTYLDYLTEYASVASEASRFAHDLIKICRHVGGDALADQVSNLVLADYSAIWRYTLDFLADVFTPLYPLIEQALRNEREITFRLGGVEIVATPLVVGRAWLSISRENVNMDGRQKTVIGLVGGSFKPDGSGLSLSGAYGGSLGEILRMLERASRAFKLLNGDEQRELFAAYLPQSAPDLV